VLRLHAGRTQPLPLRRASASAAQELLDCGRERLRGAEPREEQRGLLLGRGVLGRRLRGGRRLRRARLLLMLLLLLLL